MNGTIGARHDLLILTCLKSTPHPSMMATGLLTRLKAPRNASGDTKMNVSPPLDFSFCNMTVVGQTRRHSPRRGVKRYRRTEGGLYLSRALRLNNNRLASLEGIQAAAYQVLDDPEQLTWLDLSFNKLTSVTPEVAQAFPHLKILYLHGNQLQDLDNVLRTLGPLTQLYSLTLHGNPLQELKGYKQTVLNALTGLRSLDFTNVTAAERRRQLQDKHAKKIKSKDK